DVIALMANARARASAALGIPLTCDGRHWQSAHTPEVSLLHLRALVSMGGTAVPCHLRPRFKGVWYAATNFAPIRLSDTSQGQYPRHHRRSDDSPGRYAPE